MLTVKDIQEVQFTKKMGGYNTAEVDEFLDKCAETVEALTAQAAENAQKMQVLAETVLQYREQEDTIRTALIAAQKAADSILEEARQQVATLQSDVEKEVQKAREQALEQTKAEQDELRRVKKEVSEFKSRLLTVYREHLTLINVLEDSFDEEEETVQEMADNDLPCEAEQDNPQPAEEVASISEEEPVRRQPVYTGVLPDFSALELDDEDED
ncbi:MAG: DivIVA domain-containing protein [Clostridia bacterium]|nr:DivIVA domain-containing protein [Clostridia bacterium]